jgi:hypothetical protein
MVQMQSRGELMRQRQILIEMANSGSVEPGVVDQAQAAISRDISIFQAANALQAEEHKAGRMHLEAQRRLLEMVKSGEIETRVEAELVARILVSVLAGKRANDG